MEGAEGDPTCHGNPPESHRRPLENRAFPSHFGEPGEIFLGIDLLGTYCVFFIILYNSDCFFGAGQFIVIYGVFFLKVPLESLEQ